MKRSYLKTLAVCIFLVGLSLSTFPQRYTQNEAHILAAERVNNNTPGTVLPSNRTELHPHPGLLAKPSSQSNGKDWTFMVYMSANNNLDQVSLSNLHEMEEVGSDPNVNIIALVDRHDKTTLYAVTKTSAATSATSSIASRPVRNSPFSSELDMGDPKNLVTFVDWTIENYPASHYVLVLWGHGLGWKGVSFDGNNGNDALTPAKLRSALTSIKYVNGSALDIIGFDACMMQMAEFVSNISEYHLADYIVGSEESEPGPGWNYRKILTDLEADSSQDAEALAENITQTYIRQYPSDKITMSAIQASALDNLHNEINGLAGSLLLSQEWGNIAEARKQTEHFNEPSYIDLFDFSSHIRSDVSNAAVIEEASAIQNSIKKAVVSNQANSTHPDAYGLSIYFPSEGGVDKSYSRYTVDMSGWSDFLTAYLKHQVKN